MYIQEIQINKGGWSYFHFDAVEVRGVSSDFFLPLGTGTGTHSIGKNGVKIKRIGIYYQFTCNVKLISKVEKVRTRQDALISLW